MSSQGATCWLIDLGGSTNSQGITGLENSPNISRASIHSARRELSLNIGGDGLELIARGLLDRRTSISIC